MGVVRSGANKISLRKLCCSAEVEENSYVSLPMPIIMNHLVTILFLIPWILEIFKVTVQNKNLIQQRSYCYNGNSIIKIF